MRCTSKWSCTLLSKIQLRKNCKEKRLLISNTVRHTAAVQAADIFKKSSFFLNSHHIACYYANAQEFDSLPVIETILGADKKCYLPILKEKKLEFVTFHSGDLLEFNKYGIYEPVTKNYFPTSSLDLIIAPLIGFDLKGNRLGTGGGYYDRSLSFLKHTQKPLFIGLAYEIQQLAEIPTDPWDIKLNAVLTEKNLYFT